MASVRFAQPLRLDFRCAGRLTARPVRISSPKSTLATKPTKEKLNWPEYLAIRGGKRRWQLVGELGITVEVSFRWNKQAFTIPCAALGFFGGATYFGTLETDPTKPIMASICNIL